ncbi:MAG TPA: ABC transporter permease [Permianibacter sp.]|nr:ABC transporter permease [Permianibacter sp.]
MSRFSWQRFLAIVRKEFIQMRRDRLTFAMMIGVPLLQLTLFGFAINADPKHLPTAVLNQDDSPFSRSLIAAMQTSQYFVLTETVSRRSDADALLKRGDVQFVLEIPGDFSRRLLRGEKPALLLTADATDPAATGNAVATLNQLVQQALQPDLHGPLQPLAGAPPAFELRLHKRYNPEGITQYNIVPGLLGVILTMTMIMMTALAITKEAERGTMEALLAMPLQAAEVMLGKIVPYIFVGYIQVAVVLLSAAFLFGVPIVGSIALLMACILLFILANLAVGISISSVARSQTQAMQMTFFFFLPSLLLSGFMFPFRGMPTWAQWLGEVFPLTHFLRIVRGILLKGNGVIEVSPALLALTVFTLVVMAIGLKKYRRTLD